MAGIMKNKAFLALAVLVLVSLPAAYFFFIKPQLADKSAEASAPPATSTTPAGETPGQVGPTYTMEERLVNVQGPATALRYLRLEVVLEFEPEDPNFYTLTGESHTAAQAEFLAEIAPKAPVIDDTVLSVVSSKSIEQIVSATGKDRLKTEIADAVTERIGAPKVVNVYFTQFVTQ